MIDAKTNYQTVQQRYREYRHKTESIAKNASVMCCTSCGYYFPAIVDDSVEGTN